MPSLRPKGEQTRGLETSILPVIKAKYHQRRLVAHNVMRRHIAVTEDESFRPRLQRRPNPSRVVLGRIRWWCDGAAEPSPPRRQAVE
jgi:hypothetical protein